MAAKSIKIAVATKPEKSGPLFAFGLDDKNESLGGRFAEFDDRLANDVLNMGLTLVILPSFEFAEIATKLLAPGKRHSSGQLFIPRINQQVINDFDLLP